MTGQEEWLAVCSTDDLPPETGVAALLGDRQVAIFRTVGDEYYALANQDPYSKANIMSRGIVGTRGEVDTVASPMYKQIFDLATGVALDDSSTRLDSWSARAVDGQVEVEVKS